jgi:hypothetical protein
MLLGSRKIANSLVEDLNRTRRFIWGDDDRSSGPYFPTIPVSGVCMRGAW